MASEWPEFKLDHTWPAFCWLEGDVADEIASGWMEWLPEHETTVDEDIGNAARVYLSVDAARAWQAFRDWCDGTAEQWQARVDATPRISVSGGSQVSIGGVFNLEVKR